MDHQQVVTFLLEHGWQKSSCMNQEIWCKRWPDAPTCKLNDSRPGIQAVVTVHVNGPHIGYTIDVTGQKPDDVWVELKAYGIGAELPTILHSQCEQLVAAWTLLATPKPDKPFLKVVVETHESKLQFDESCDGVERYACDAIHQGLMRIRNAT